MEKENLKRIKISEKCMACGLCLCNKYIMETEEGKAKVEGAGIVEKKDINAIEELVANCPARAISLSTVQTISKEQLLKKLDQRIEQFSLAVPEREELEYDTDKANISIPYGISGEHQYKYSSYNKAKAALRAGLNQALFSRRKELVQEVISQYQSEVLYDYIEYKETKNNFYYNANKKAQNVLEQMIVDVKSCNPDIKNLNLTIQTRPNKRELSEIEELSEYILYTANPIVNDLSDSVYSLDSYVDYADIDEMDTYEEGFRGRMKEVTKYCFTDTYKALEEMKKDIQSTLKWNFSEKTVELAYDSVKLIVRDYGKMLKRELEEKKDSLLAEL